MLPRGHGALLFNRVGRAIQAVLGDTHARVAVEAAVQMSWDGISASMLRRQWPGSVNWKNRRRLQEIRDHYTGGRAYRLETSRIQFVEAPRPAPPDVAIALQLAQLLCR